MVVPHGSEPPVEEAAAGAGGKVDEEDAFDQLNPVDEDMAVLLLPPVIPRYGVRAAKPLRSGVTVREPGACPPAAEVVPGVRV